MTPSLVVIRDLAEVAWVQVSMTVSFPGRPLIKTYLDLNISDMSGATLRITSTGQRQHGFLLYCPSGH